MSDPATPEGFREILDADGYVEAHTDDILETGWSLLASHMASVQMSADAIDASLEDYSTRPYVHLPHTGWWHIDQHERAVSDKPICFAWVDPARIQLSKPEWKWMHHRQFDNPFEWNRPLREGMVEFATRLQNENGAHHARAWPFREAGLEVLLGIDRQLDHAGVDLDAWDTALGRVFQVSMNGNHRTAALAALGAPCILARVTPQPRVYAAPNPAQLTDDMERYLRMLTVLGVAHMPDHVLGPNSIVTDWPFLIAKPADSVRALQAAEQLAGTGRTHRVGAIDRGYFEDPGALAALAETAAQALSDLRHHAGQPPAQHDEGQPDAGQPPAQRPRRRRFRLW